MLERKNPSTDTLRTALLSDGLTMDKITDTDQRSISDLEYQAVSRPKNIFYTDKIIKTFVCIFYGIIPWLFADHKRKWYSLFLPICFVLLHWYSVIGYIYCAEMFWIRSKTNSPVKFENVTSKNITRVREIIQLPEIPFETLLLLLGLALSGAITVTMAVVYFYSKSNNFSGNRQGEFNLLPRLHLNNSNSGEELQEQTCDLPEREWLIANLLLILGILNVLFVLVTDFGTDTLFDFHGIREFLKTATPSNRAIYILAVSFLFWGFGGTVCACCIFHVMSRNIVVHVNRIHKCTIDTNMHRDDFFALHERLLVYTESMIDKFKYWFAIHNSMFVLLVAAMIFEWISFMRNSKYAHNYILSQVAGTILICYKFAFPFFSASRVTVGFREFYMQTFRRNQIKDIPELLILQDQFGFKIFGLRITPSIALLVFFSSFLGILKFVSAEVHM